MNDVYMVVSPNGGRGRAAAAAPIVRQVIEDSGHRAIDVSGRSAEETAEAARSAVRDGASRLIAVGGDGIVHLAAQGVIDTEAVLGVVPAGTGNDYARTFGLTGASVEQATRRALGAACEVDAVYTDRERWTISSITGGFSVDVNKRADRLSFPKGASRYTVATLLCVPMLRHRQLVVTVDGERREFRSAFFAVCNIATFGGGMAICPDADPCDGLLDVAVIGEVRRTALLRLLPKVFSGGHVSHPEVLMLRGRSVTIEGETMDLMADGEAVGATPITLQAEPAAIRLAADPFKARIN